LFWSVAGTKKLACSQRKLMVFLRRRRSIMKKFLVLVLVLGIAGSAVAALPATGANVLLHLDASSVGQADGTPVATWTSTVGPGDMISKGGETPTYKTNQINGLPVVSLNSNNNDQWMTLNDGLNDVWCNDAYTAFVVGTLTSASVTSYIFMGETDERIRYDPGKMYWGDGIGGKYDFTDTSNAHIHSWVFGDAVYLDGADTGTTWTGPLTKGQSLGGKRYKPWLDPPTGPTNTEVDFDYAEVILYDGALTAAERNAVTMYLGDKYDIAAVPEPATMMLFGLGGLALLRKRR
jgi:hypothetical protein